MLYEKDNALIWEYDHESLRIEPWGANAFRVRASKDALRDDDWALLPAGESSPNAAVTVAEDGRGAAIVNGKIRAEVDKSGRIAFTNDRGETLLRETEKTYQLKTGGRDIVPIPGSSDYAVTVRFESNPGEKLYGMGQYQQSLLNLKGCRLELTHSNSQASVPFLLSNRGYGMLWHNPAIGQASFNVNVTEWTAASTRQLDYWIAAGDTPAEIEEAYAGATGKVPMMPEFGMGFWQCKLRYRSQEELLGVAREHVRRGLPVSVIVIDFFHWTNQGDWKFDEKYWPDPEGMVRELKEMGIELMVSVWPTVQTESENYGEMVEKGYLVRSDRGVRTQFQFLGQNEIFDATHPDARRFLWEKIKRNYYDKGIRLFWLDEAEPEFAVYDHDIYRYHAGPALQVGNWYPSQYSRTFYEGMTGEGQDNVMNLVRAAWAGSQRYGALAWSGDIASTFEVLGHQVRAGLNMAIAGIPWWTTDIGGFHGGNPDDPAFRECIVRWFQYGTFCPVMRLHGDRAPYREADTGLPGGGLWGSGADNEVWSYGEEAYDIFADHMRLRERLRPYIAELMKAAHEKGTPPMRPLFYDFPDDEAAWDVDDQFLFGPDLLVAPILQADARSRSVYLPAGAKWTDAYGGETYGGGQTVLAEASLERIPVYLKNGAKLPIRENRD
ncbi:glycoside hydrolase family 31 protein [Saccharibacillus alkalitolerans]|uniref:Glycoside hydrolase family 31 protein n=1 Tax=Saccharibacillus alkalitolerans TaxID=2705290 RepID=A0ABX0F1Z3_9BACL|nr:glycoside hydrolase family 31 protein [Saccharibacillus alkalitolerans]NGZ75008.1 glycoside hydrolase family 31 protein [Saccharibacillus alkalitolerans]